MKEEIYLKPFYIYPGATLAWTMFRNMFKIFQIFISSNFYDFLC
jgi:hypothetical protein